MSARFVGYWAGLGGACAPRAPPQDLPLVKDADMYKCSN